MPPKKKGPVRRKSAAAKSSPEPEKQEEQLEELADSIESSSSVDEGTLRGRVSAHERRAESGNAVSQYEMGKCFVKLNEVDHAIVWLERASKSGHARAMCRLAALLHQQKRDEANETTAFGLLARAAELGSMEGMFGAANRLLVGLGVEKDEENASALFSFLFDSLVSSTHHHEKRSVLKTILSGLIEYFSSKRESGKVEALLNLSSLPPFSDVLAAVTLYKSFVEVDAAKASIYLERAAEMGHEESMYLLAKELQASGKEEDGARAVELYRRIWRDHSSVAAVRALGNIFLDGQPGVPADKRAAAQFYIQGAQWGDCDCMFNLGCCFELGVGINKDVAKAVEWYRRAALEHNDAEAMKVLTRVYMSLDDEENALLFAKRLAEEKQQPEQLIKCLVRGIGTAVDLDAARRLGWDGNDEFDSEQMEIDEEGEEEADEGEEEKILGETPQVTSLRSKREQQDELAAAESKRSKRDGGQVKTPVAFAQSPVKTNESPKGFPLFGANSPIRFIASSPRQQQLSVSPVPKGQQPVVSPIVRGQRNAVMSDWSIDQVVGYFLELGCDEKETSELRKQKIDGFALTRITDWRILFHDLAIPMGCCLKHDALMSKK